MSDILIRGIPKPIHEEVQKWAADENLSVNQMLLNVIKNAVEKREQQKKSDKRQTEAFRRLQEFRERMYRKYGLQEDSTKIIRHFRDTRNQ